MKKIDFRTASIFFLLVSVMSFSPVFAKDSQPLPEVSHDGLALYENSKVGLAYILPDVDLSGYKKIILLEAKIAFKKSWKRDQNRNIWTSGWVRDKDVTRMISRGKELFEHVFTNELKESGYEVVTAPAEDVLLVRPSIVDLDVTAPDLKTLGRTHTYAASAGEATLYVELYDSVTGQILVRAFDRKVDRDTRLHWKMARTSVSNTQDATRALTYWARLLTKALDRAKKDHIEQ